MNPLFRQLISSTGVVVGFVLQWVSIVAIAGALVIAAMFFSYGLTHFGNNLQQAASDYEKAERLETLKTLYGSVDWAAVVESSNKRLEAACEKLSKKQRRGVCPAEVNT